MSTTKVQIFRLNTGEDIISEYKFVHSRYELWYPMKILFHRAISGEVGIMLIPWLPDEILSVSECSLEHKDVLTTCKPRDGMLSFYDEAKKHQDQRLKKYDKQLEEHLLLIAKDYKESGQNHSVQLRKQLLQEAEEDFLKNEDEDFNETIN